MNKQQINEPVTKHPSLGEGVGRLTGIFVGSFNPFTTGHQSVVRRALPLFDRLVIGVVGDHVSKPGLPPANERIHAIETLYKDEPRIEVKAYYGLAVDFAREVGARFIVKGVRSVKDFEYEREQADINRLLTSGEVETILLYSEPQYSSVSSSMVRELQHFGVDVSAFLPK
ncbi:MAG: pantetheine-phosphate adenylyltransferase [Prevotella sp.]|nr:pantetheine-phosphate adenylyltransferase [Prevotella sp.]